MSFTASVCPSLSIRFVVSLMTVAALTACGGGSGGGSDDGGSPVEQSTGQYLPTDNGITWEYDNGVESSFDGTIVTDDIPFSVLTHSPGGGKEYFHSQDDQIVLRGFYAPSLNVEGTTYSADVVLSRNILIWADSYPVGQSTTVSGGGEVTISPTYGERAISFSATRNIVGTETVTVPAGTFTAIHATIEMEVSTVVEGTTILLPYTAEYWFTQDLGIIKRKENGITMRLVSTSGISIPDEDTPQAPGTDLPADDNPDSDGDGYPDASDAFPNNSSEWEDLDDDGIGNNADTDDDGDSIADADDAFPLDPSEWLDTDNDGIGNNADNDDDGDSFNDNEDAFPLDSTEWLDTDNDSVGNNTDTDDDGDSVADADDAFPLDPSEWVDTDNDGIGNNADTDDDGDSFNDNEDAFPLDSTEWLDTDNDGVGNNTDTDDDGDSVADVDDAFPLDPSEWLDTDNDGTGNNADTDDDGDSFADEDDAFPLDSSEWLDTDNDGTGNNADTDDDGDTVADTDDAFPLDPAEWLDTDNDGVGNNADPNDDNDEFADADDPMPLDSKAPGTVFTVSPGVVTQNQSGKLIVSGKNFSIEDVFYINGTPVSNRLMGTTGTELYYSAPVAGNITVEIHYPEHGYTSSTTLTVVEPVYYPYSVIYSGGANQKAYFDASVHSLFTFNSAMSAVQRFQYTDDQGWQETRIEQGNLKSMGISPDMKKMIALKEDRLLPISPDTLSVVSNERILAPGFRAIMSEIEFDYLNRAVITSDFQGSGHTNVLSYDLEERSESYGEQSNLIRLYNSSISRSGDGSHIVLGERGLSPVQPLVSYRPGDSVLSEMSPRESYAKGDLSRDGDVILINNARLYNRVFSQTGALAVAGSKGAAIASDGSFVITAASNSELHWYDTTELTGQTLTPDSVASLEENVGTITELLISDDGLTLFVFGTSKTLVIPVWQVKQDNIGHPSTCPLSGCDGIAIATGAETTVPVPVIPELDSQWSPAEHVSPTYAGVGNQIEVIITGAGFTADSVVMFGSTPAAQSRFISNKEMRARLPELDAGTYTVTVDGHQLNAPEFTVVEQAEITGWYWLIGDTTRELIYDALNHALYALNTTAKTVYRIDLHTNQYISQSVEAAFDLTWCAADDHLYLATGTGVAKYKASDLTFVKNVVVAEVTALECVAEGNLVITGEDQWESFMLFDTESEEVSYTSGTLYSPMVDGVSSRGDVVFIGESGITSPDRARFTPHLESNNVTAGAGSYTMSHWSDDGSLGVINNLEVHNGSMARIGTLTDIVSETIGAVAVAADASAIFVFTSTEKLHRIPFDPDTPEDLQIASTENHRLGLGSIKRMDVSLDGKFVFVSGNNGVGVLRVQ
ncbi:IPT/TIG domain-containing protein [Thalassolituus sp.]|uniref:IPT/TIG domain-containing protein n=1 Tax=Thalassolituus sp. TaxID=2030822 RepID=UPI003512DE11